MADHARKMIEIENRVARLAGELRGVLCDLPLPMSTQFSDGKREAALRKSLVAAIAALRDEAA
jgi:hypothetical protein